MTQIIGLGGQKNVNFTNWDTNQQYRPGDMVVYNSIIYTTTTNIPAGTPWGAEWAVAVSGGAATYAAEADVAFNLDATSPANLTIAGGNVGDVLTTDGTGNVTWEAPGGAAALPIANGTSQFDIPVADSTVEITSNGVHTWAFGDTGTLSVPGAIIPDANITYDLGNATNRFRDLYLSNNTIYMGDQSISANAGIITFSGNIDASGMVASGDVVIAGNLTVTGNTTQINVTDLMVQDPIIAMGGGANGANATTYDAKDRGILLQDYYPDGSGVNNHFFGWVSSTAQFEAIANVTDASTGVIAGTTGNIAASWFVGNVVRDKVSGVTGRDGQLQFNTSTGNLTSSERYFIGANGAGALNISRDGSSGTGVAIYAYSNSSSIATTYTSRARGTKTAPLPAQVGDRVFSTQGQIYTGVGTTTADGQTGWTPLAPAPYMAADITALPTSPSTTYGSKLSFAASNAATNSTRIMTFNDDGSLNVPGNITTTGDILPQANITYDLGSPTQRWKDLYLSNNTIYMGDQTIGANATHINLTGTVNASSFEGVLGNGTSTIAISAADGNIDFTVGGTQQWAFGTDGALVAANTTASISGTSDQTLSIRSGSLEIGTADNLVPDGTVNDFTFVGGDGGAGDAPGHGGNLVMSTGVGGLGLNGNDGAPGGAFKVLTGLGGQCDAGATPGPSGEIYMETAPALAAVGAPGSTSGPITLITGDGGDSDTDQAGSSGAIELRTGNGGTGDTNAWAGEAGSIILATGDGGEIPDNSRGAEGGGSIELRTGDGGNGGNGGRGGDIDLLAGDGGTGTDGRGGRGGQISLKAGNGNTSETSQPGSGGLIEIIAGNATDSTTFFGGSAYGVEIETGNGGGGVDASGVDHQNGSPWGDGGPFRVTTGIGGTVEQGEAGYGGNIELTTGVGGNTGTSGQGSAGDAGGMSVILGNGGESNDGRGGNGGSFTMAMGTGGTGSSSGGTGGSFTVTAGNAGDSSSSGGEPGNISLTAGNASSQSTNSTVQGGNITFTAGTGSTNQTTGGLTPGLGGEIIVRGGTGGAGGEYGADGGNVTIVSGTAGTGTVQAGTSGIITIKTADGISNGVTNMRSGAMTIGTGNASSDSTLPGSYGGWMNIVSGTGSTTDIDGGDGGQLELRPGGGGSGGTGNGGNAGRLRLVPASAGSTTDGTGGRGGDILASASRGGSSINGDGGAGGGVTIGAGAGGDSETSTAGNGGDVKINAGSAGDTVSGVAGEAGSIELAAGTSSDPLNSGNIVLRTNSDNTWTFGADGTTTLPEINNEQSTIVGTRKIIAPTLTAVTAPVATPTVLYTPTANTTSFKLVVRVNHDSGMGLVETEIFEVFAATGFSGQFFSVSNRLNTFGSSGGLNDTVVTIDASLVVSVETKYGTTNTVTFSVTEFTI